MPRKRTKPILINTIPEEDIDNGMVTQLNYQGNPETLKADVYRHKLICRCSQPRYYLKLRSNLGHPAENSYSRTCYLKFLILDDLLVKSA